MITQQMLDFIRQQTAAGKSREEVKQALAQSGWKEADIEEGFAAFSSGAPLPAAAPGSQTLPSATSILKDSWELYKKRLGVLLGVYLIPYAIIVVLGILMGTLKTIGPKTFSVPIIVILFLAMLIAMIYLGTWSEAALIFAIKDSGENIGVEEAYKRSRSKIWTLFAVNLLTGLAVLGGMILLIIPGLIFAVWFAFSGYIAVLEGTGGTAALSRSKQYVKGRFWPVAGKLAYIILIVILLSIALGILESILRISNSEPAKAVINGIFNVFWAPLAAIYTYKLYTYFKSSSN